MTHSTVNTEIENQGSRTVAYHEINVTSLDVNGEEGYDPASELGIDGEDRFGIGVRGQTNQSVRWGYNLSSGNLTARDPADNTVHQAGENVGHVTLEVVGQ